MSKIVRPIVITESMIVSSNLADEAYPEFDPAATYAQGALVIKASTHHFYESLVDANFNNEPTTESDPLNPSYWLDRGATNRFRMFDKKISAQSSRLSNITFTLLPNALANSLILLNVAGLTINVQVNDPADGSVVYNKTYSLRSRDGITSYYLWCFERITRRDKLILTDLPFFLGAPITVSISAPGETVACGECIIGQSRQIGLLRLGGQFGINDYSSKQTDTFGNKTVKQGGYSRTGSMLMWLDNNQVDAVDKLLSDYRATPIVCIGDESMGISIIYGFYLKFNVEWTRKNISLISTEWEGLT